MSTRVCDFEAVPAYLDAGQTDGRHAYLPRCLLTARGQLESRTPAFDPRILTGGLPDHEKQMQGSTLSFNRERIGSVLGIIYAALF